MIGVDTNILVRYFTQDDPQQSQIAEILFDQYLNKPQSIFINNIVICELIWVLDSGYNYSKAQITKTIMQILSTKEFAFEHHSLLWLSLELYESGNIDFSDALISQLNKSHQCITTYTFDKQAIKLEGFADLRSFTKQSTHAL